MSGYFFSPSFPGFYLDDSFCTWQITVPDRNIIRLTFLEFRLRDHPTCENCFLEIFDGGDETAPAIGKVCGHIYPPVFVSSSNYLTVVLRCHGKPSIARFKAFYQSVIGTYFFFSESLSTTAISYEGLMLLFCKYTMQRRLWHVRKGFDKKTRKLFISSQKVCLRFFFSFYVLELVVFENTIQ